MKRSLLWVGTVLALAGCGGSVATPSPSGAAPNARQRNGVSGQVSQASAAMLDVSTSAGDVTVNLAASTTYRRIATDQLADIAPGMCAVITGSKDSTGAITATAVTLTAASGSGCASPAANRGGTGASPRPQPNGGGNGGGALSGNRAIVFGAVSAVTGTQVTVHGGSVRGLTPSPNSGPTPATDITVTVPSTATISRSDSIALSDVHVDDCVTANGQRGSDGSIAATAVTVFPATASGCVPTRGGGFGGGRGNGGNGGGGNQAPPGAAGAPPGA